MQAGKLTAIWGPDKIDKVYSTLQACAGRSAEGHDGTSLVKCLQALQ